MNTLSHLRILMLEDSAMDAELLARELQRGGMAFSLQRVDTEREFRDALESADPDVILADYNVPGFDGIAALKVARVLVPHVPFIFVSGSIGEERAIQALREGATDYVLKDRPSRLAPAITRAVDERRGRSVRERTAEALRVSEERLRFAGEATQELVLDWHIPTDRMSYNHALTSVWGHDPQDREIDFAWLMERIHPEDRERVRAAKRALVESGDRSVMEFRFARGDGSYGFVLDRLLLVRDQAGRPVRMICALLDVTEERMADDRLRASELRFRSVAQSASDAIIVSNADEEIIFWNDAAVRVFGYTIAEALGRPIARLVCGRVESPVLSMRANYLRTGDRAPFAEPIEFIGRRKDGSEFVGETTISPWQADGETFFTSVIRDVTDRVERLQQERLRHAVLEALVHTANEEDVVQMVLAAAGRELRCTRGEFWRPDPETLRLCREAEWGAHDRPGAPHELDMTDGTAGRVWARGAAVVSESDDTELGFPIIEHGAVTGVFVLRCTQRLYGHPALLQALNELGRRIGEYAERRRSEKTLVESQASLAEAQRLAKVGSWSYDARTQYVSWSEEAFRVFDIAPGEFDHTYDAYLARVHPEDLERIRRLTTPPLAAAELQFNHRIVTGAGTVKVVHSRARVAEGTPEAPLRLVGTIQDITAERLAQETIRRLNRETELILSCAADAIVGLNAAGKAIFANPAATRAIGWSREAILAAPSFCALLHSPASAPPHDGEGCPIEATLSDGVTRNGEEVFANAAGAPLDVEYQCAALVEEDGSRTGAVLTFRDVTTQKRIEQQLSQSERVSVLGRLAASVAHEFNNVLMGMQPFAEMLLRRVAADDVKARRATEQILTSIGRGKRVTEGILRFAQPARPMVRSVDLATWLRRLAPELDALAGSEVTVELDVPGEPLYASFDPDQMQQVITNLVLNARDAMTSAGTITVAATADAAASRFSQPGSVVLSVRDTGSGIPPHVLPHVFEPLFTTKRNGTGLGLAVAHQVVSRGGSAMHVQSELGEGTTFTIVFPAGDAPAGATEAVTNPTRAAAAPGTLLLVEDEPSVAAGLTALLEEDGMIVRVAATAQAALEVLKSLRPDAVILDVSLPDASGTDLYEEIARRHGDLPVVFSTGDADMSVVAGYLREHVAFLRKPYEHATLIETLVRVREAVVRAKGNVEAAESR